MNTTFVGFVRKEFYHILRDRRTLIVLVGMPIIMLILFGYAIRNEIQDVRVAIVDPSRDSATAEIINRFRGSNSFVVVGYMSGRDAIEEAFREGRITVAVLFEANFEQKLKRHGRARVQVITDASNPNTASTVLAYTTAAIQSVQASLPPYASFDIQHAGLADNRPIIPEFRMRYNPELKSIYLFVPGLMALILMLVSALMTSITITRERETGTMEVLLVSPLHPLQIILGKVVPYLAISIVNIITILLLSSIVFEVPIRGSIPLLLAESFLFTLCALTLGILISSRSTSLQTATMIALAGLLMPTVLLSGFIFPIASMPEPLQVLSHAIPAKWFLVIVRGIMIRGVGLEFVWKESLVLVGMTLLFAGLSVRGFHDRLE